VKVQTGLYSDNQWQLDETAISADIVFVFGDRVAIQAPELFTGLKSLYPSAEIVGCSSSGNVLGEEVSESAAVCSAVKFERGRVNISVVDLAVDQSISSVSSQLIENLPSAKDLKHIFVLSDGLNVNGTELAAGMSMSSSVPVTGGLSGDGTDFHETSVIANAPGMTNRLVAVGFYGDALTIRSGCCGGWSSFGAERTITKSKDNVLYEIDGEPALDLYKTYLGEYAEGLPGSGLRFPLSIKANDEDEEVIRTLLAVDEDSKSITFAGNVPEGYSAKLMKTQLDDLIDASGTAAESIELANEQTSLGLVVSCVGRRIVLNQLVDEELEAVQETLGGQMQLVGFYSYGEIAPFSGKEVACSLHNQTMTLTTIFEDVE